MTGFYWKNQEERRNSDYYTRFVAQYSLSIENVPFFVYLSTTFLYINITEWLFFLFQWEGRQLQLKFIDNILRTFFAYYCQKIAIRHKIVDNQAT